MKDSAVKRWSSFHRFLYRWSGGLLGTRLVSNDMLLLTTTGRRSGRPHTVPLLYLREGEQVVVIASYGGRESHPSWYLNLKAEPVVDVQIGARKERMVARTANSEEREHWWPRVLDAYDGYAEYQSRTNRVIPVVILEPE